MKWPAGDLLFSPGQQEAVVEQVQVYWLGGQLEFGSRNTHGLHVHLQKFTVLHQPARLRNQREDLERRKMCV